jgi:hypothetical protein
MLYVGDGTVEDGTEDKVACPFGGLAGELLESVLAVDEVLLEPFPSSLGG